MRILGVDPGTRVAGYGIIDVSGTKVEYVECGALTLPADAPMEIRLKELGDDLDEIVAEFAPDELALESSFSSPKNYQSALKVSLARGVVMYIAAKRHLAVHEFPPSLVKKALSLSGKSTKRQMQAAAQRIFKLKNPPASDAADALAVAICRASTGQMAMF